MENQNDLRIEPCSTRRRKFKNAGCVPVDLINKKDRLKKVSIILKKCESTWTKEDLCLLEKNADLVRQLKIQNKKILISRERSLEKEDSINTIKTKVGFLAKIISQAKHLICYTGAGISTSAQIPDYRGSNGIWTLLKKGQKIGNHDLSLANPTYTHMALFELYKRKLLHHIVSQNCDGLHLRSGFPVKSISEIHGNMYIEICSNCENNTVYWRLFDTTEITARFSHKTMRKCFKCGSHLRDTIVHFGEKGIVNWPLNWPGACHNAEKADVILCLGSSLKVLKKYQWLWQMDRPSKNRAKICILNLQWTPKDNISTVKINGKCDVIMKLLMNYLDIDVRQYNKWSDPIFAHATALLTEELHTVSQPQVKREIKVENNENYSIVKKLMHLSNSGRRNHIKNKVCIDENTKVGTLNDVAQYHIPNKPVEKTKFPFWFDISYAYSGFHNIVLQPSLELNIWDSQILPLYQIKREAAECTFCFDNYTELECQFYKSWSLDINKNKLARDRLLCECCESDGSKNSVLSFKKMFHKNRFKIQAGWFGKGYSKNTGRGRRV